MRDELVDLNFQEVKKVVAKIINLLNQSDREIMHDLLDKTESDSSNLLWLKLHLSHCLNKSNI